MNICVIFSFHFLIQFIHKIYLFRINSVIFTKRVDFVNGSFHVSLYLSTLPCPHSQQMIKLHPSPRLSPYSLHLCPSFLPTAVSNGMVLLKISTSPVFLPSALPQDFIPPLVSNLFPSAFQHIQVITILKTLKPVPKFLLSRLTTLSFIPSEPSNYLKRAVYAYSFNFPCNPVTLPITTTSVSRHS